MKVISVRPAPIGLGSAVAHVDLQFNDDIIFYNLRVSRRTDGGYSVFAPKGRGSEARVAVFSPRMVREIASAALVAIGGSLNVGT